MNFVHVFTVVAIASLWSATQGHSSSSSSSSSPSSSSSSSSSDDGGPRYCNDGCDCKDCECCVNFRPLKGKRDVANQLLKSEAVGMCQKRGTLGSGCFVRPLQEGYNGAYYEKCPCQKGFTCEATGLPGTVPLGPEGFCKEPKRSCESGSDCRKDECCVTPSRVIGKRDTLGSPLGSPLSYCEPVGKDGDACLVDPLRPETPGLYFDRCPCKNNLNCEGTGTKTVPIGETGVCVAPRCDTSAECGPKECCVSIVRPIGKRDTLLQPRGRCQPMGEEGKACLVRNGSGKPKSEMDPVFESCPCLSNLKCEGIGLQDNPLGEIGECKK